MKLQVSKSRSRATHIVIGSMSRLFERDRRLSFENSVTRRSQ